MPGSLQQVSYGSGPVNGQLIGVRTASGYNPINYGVGRASVPVASPVTMPPSVTTVKRWYSASNALAASVCGASSAASMLDRKRGASAARSSAVGSTGVTGSGLFSDLSAEASAKADLSAILIIAYLLYHHCAKNKNSPIGLLFSVYFRIVFLRLYFASIF